MQTKLKVQQKVDLLLHPRGPPLVRPLPHVEALSLFRAEESNEERAARASLALATTYDANAMDLAVDPIAITPSLPERTHQPPTHLPIPTPRAATPTPHTPPTVLTGQQMTSPVTAAPTKESANASATSSRQPNKIQSSTSGGGPGQKECAPVTVEHPLIPVAANDEEDEPMPTIDMESDSDC